MNRGIFKGNAIKYEGFTGEMFCAYSGIKGMFHWCCIFTCYLEREVAGLYDFPKHTSCTQLKNYALSKGLINTDFKTAEIGDIIFFETNNNKGDGPDHVGVVVGNSGGYISLIEGNTGGGAPTKSKVSINEYYYNNQSFDSIIDMSSYFSDSLNNYPKDKFYNAILEAKKILDDALV